LPNGNLKPVNNQTNANRRPADIMFAKIESDICFNTIDPAITGVFPFSFFLRLESQNIEVMNSTGNPVQLNSFHAPDDWFDATQEELDAIWDNPQSVGKAFMLKSPDINHIHADATIEISSHLIDKIALKASWTHIVDQIYQQLCPNVVTDPARVIQDIHQATTDEKGEKVILKVEEYFNAIQRMTNFLSKTETWTIDVVQHFITHLIDDVRQQISATGYSYDPTSASRQPYSQIMSLQRGFEAASSAEQQINRVKRIAKHEISAQSFVAQVNTSVADKTIEKYKKRDCWGCGGEHTYANRQGQILCPNKDRPGVFEQAAKARKDYNERINKRKSGKKRSANTLLTDALQDMSAAEIQTLISKTTKHNKKPNLQTDRVISFLINATCFQTNIPHKPLLPISIETNLPHLNLLIGLERKCCLSIAYDTCAVLCVGSASFHLAIAERVPHVVKSLTWAKDKYSPIALSGVVSDKEGKTQHQPTASLPAIIEYYMPYKSKEDYQTTLKIALGEMVSINTIMGMSMIKPAKLSLDLNDGVIDPGVLDTEPFPVTYKQTIKSIPDFHNFEASGKSLVTETIPPRISIEDIRKCRQVVFTTKTVKVTSPDKSQEANSKKDDSSKDLPPYPSFFQSS
jgi:hypothetical protein